MSDARPTRSTIVAAADRVVVEWTARTTHTGEFRGIPPTSKQLSYAGSSMYRIADGKIAASEIGRD